MNKTAKYWLVANSNCLLIGFWLLILLMLILIVILFPGINIAVSGFVVSLVFSAPAFSFKDKGIVFNVVIGAWLYIALIYMALTAGYVYPVIAMLLSLAVGFILSIPIAKFTKDNFDEIVSRRMRWRSSNVDLFDMQWKFTLNRYIVFAFGIAAIVLFLLTAHYSIANPDWLENSMQTVEAQNANI